MKTNLNIILIVLLLSISCSDNNPVESKYSEYTGTWVWYQSCGGIGGFQILPEEGVTIKRTYDENKFFKILRNDTVKVLAKYSFGDPKDGLDQINYSLITSSYSYFDSLEFGRIYNDTLMIWDGWIDGYFHFYYKVD